MGTKITKNGIVQIYQPLRLEKPRNFRLGMAELHLVERFPIGPRCLDIPREDQPR